MGQIPEQTTHERRYTHGKEAYKKVSSETNNRDATTEFVNDVIGEIFTTKEGLEHLMNHAQKNLNQKEILQSLRCSCPFFHRSFRDRSVFMTNWRISCMQSAGLHIKI